MAKRKPTGRKNRRNFVAIPFQTKINVGTPNNGDVVSVAAFTLGEDLFHISVEGSWTRIGGTAGEGPILVGYAHGDLTDIEIGEALDASLSDPDDIIAKEKSRRPVRRAGNFHGEGETSASRR